MATEVLTQMQALPVRSAGRLLLIWQNPETRAFVRVAALDHLVDGRYAFRYLEAARRGDFQPLVEFPDFDSVYVSDKLPAFFGNRVMSHRRDSYPTYRHWIGLDEPGSDTPFEVMARTGAPRATDTFHIVDDLRLGSDGSVVSRFLASGVRHVPGANERLEQLHEGQRLELRCEPDNPVNNRAILIDMVVDEPVGYVPDWLVDDVHNLRNQASSLVLTAERVNMDAPPHLRLLCKIEAG
ncbi:hypothetical protein GCM10009854_28840 [Saccharopolyspora halophila]|uniref:HIRAN domain-containing protein n=1 Tax=Saccharopolyspora halophila TaxID=405551 RepID=A0ABN3GEC9_9PSEU